MANWRRRVETQASASLPSRFDLPRFLKLCAMLSSSNEGERASAAAKASDMLKAANLSWGDVVKDAKSLDDHIALGGSVDEKARAQRFWSAGGSTARGRA
jgi:hypothetical protein